MHVAFIMDGNRRWAHAQNKPSLWGHKAGAHAFKKIIQASPDLGIKTLTAFAFSLENWKRSAFEIKNLFTLFEHNLAKYGDKLVEQNVQLRIIGDREKLPLSLQKLIQRHTQTLKNPAMTVQIALNYGGKQEILFAMRQLVCHIQKNDLSFETDINEAALSQFMWNTCGDVDLLIRTSGENRLSNYLIWSMAYAEIYFTPTLWPDFSVQAYKDALAWFSQRQRRFGGGQ